MQRSELKELAIGSSSAAAVNFLIIITIVVIFVFIVVENWCILMFNIEEIVDEGWLSLGNLGELLGDWGWLVSDKILEGSTRHIGAKKVVLSITLSGENEFLSDWGSNILNKIDETFLGNVFTVENANVGLGSWCMLLVRFNRLRKITIIVIWETLIEAGGQMVGGQGSWVGHSKNWLWKSSNHHADGNVVVVIWVLGLMSILVKNGLESIVTNDFSERLEGYRVDDIEVVGR